MLFLELADNLTLIKGRYLMKIQILTKSNKLKQIDSAPVCF